MKNDLAGHLLPCAEFRANAVCLSAGGQKTGKTENFFRPKTAVTTHGYNMVSDCGSFF